MSYRWSTLPRVLYIEPGNPQLPGAVPDPRGVNFSIFSRHATCMILCLYETPDADRPAASFRLDPRRNKTGDIWHCYVPGLKPNTLYMWRAEGPFAPLEGHRYNPNKVLIDPYAKALTDGSANLCSAFAYDEHSPDRDLSFSEKQNDGCMPKCVVVDDAFDWEGDTPLNYPLKECIIYETHVRGLTRSPTAPVRHHGTYRGVTEMIGYFSKLGITSLELMPVQEFDSHERFRSNPLTGEPLSNYWGYAPIAFFAPRTAYAFPDDVDHARYEPSHPVKEFKYMVRELHKAGIEVILDVVFNHTAEGNEMGPTLSFRGIDNAIYYMLAPDRRHYLNYSGCGNTLNCNHPVLRTFIRECLRYWVVTMHVDGFRFDLGSILGRDSQGRLLENPPVIESIAEDPLLRNTKIIAEAWDAGGAYQVGSFPGGRWAEWNDRFRDDVRRYWRGDDGFTRHLATRLSGSSDLYSANGKKPFHSINFITSHDGFTLNDLVSYSQKHNEINGEENRDGQQENYSSNYGAEGPTENEFIEQTRNRQVKNFFATLLLSIGTPMLLGGDEFRRTQLGNNNPYCHDKPFNWYDWSLLKRHRDIHRFVTLLIDFRKRHPAFRREDFFRGEPEHHDWSIADILWYDEHGRPPDWMGSGRVLQARLNYRESEADRSISYLLIFNAGTEACTVSVPVDHLPSPWRKVIDTSLPSPHDFEREDEAPPLPDPHSLIILPRTLIVLIAT